LRSNMPDWILCRQLHSIMCDSVSIKSQLFCRLALSHLCFCLSWNSNHQILCRFVYKNLCRYMPHSKWNRYLPGCCAENMCGGLLRQSVCWPFNWWLCVELSWQSWLVRSSQHQDLCVGLQCYWRHLGGEHHKAMCTWVSCWQLRW